MLDITYNADLRSESGKQMTKATVEFESGNEIAIGMLFELASPRMDKAVIHVESSDVDYIKKASAIDAGEVLNYEDIPRQTDFE